MITVHMDTLTNAEYIHLIQDVNVWYINYIIGVAFRTPIIFTDKMNGLRESGRRYREFSDYKDMQDYLEEITGQEIVLESSIDPETNTEFDNKIVWTSFSRKNLTWSPLLNCRGILFLRDYWHRHK